MKTYDYMLEDADSCPIRSADDGKNWESLTIDGSWRAFKLDKDVAIDHTACDEATAKAAGAKWLKVANTSFDDRNANAFPAKKTNST